MPPAAPAWPHGDPADVVRAIVADPRFRIRAAPPTASAPSWLDLLRAWLVAQLRRLLHGIDHALGSHVRFETAIGFALIVVAFALVGYGVYRAVRAAGRGRRRGGRPAFASPAPAVPRTAAELRTAARAAAAAGRYREAAGLLFASAARALDECGRVAYDPARTPGEYRRVVGDPQFDALAGAAIVAMFAAPEPRAELFERLDGAYDRFFETAVR